MAMDQTLKVVFQGDAKQLSGTLGRIQGEFKAFGATAGRAFTGVQTAFAALGVSLTAGGLAFGIKKTIDGFDELAKASQKVGVTTESLSALGYAAQLSGSSMEGLLTGLKFLGKNLEEARQGNRDLERSFRDLGVTAEDDVETALLKIAEAFTKIPDGARKTNLAMQVFGRSGAELIPLLNSGRAGLEKFGAEAERMGIIVSGPAAKAAEEFNDNMERAGKSVSAVGIAIANTALPTIGELASAMAYAATSGESLTGVISALGTGIRNLLEGKSRKEGLTRDIDETTRRLDFLIAKRQELERDLKTAPTLTLFGKDKVGIQGDLAKNLQSIFEREQELQALQKELLNVEALERAVGKAGGDAAKGLAVAGEEAQRTSDKYKKLIESLRETTDAFGQQKLKPVEDSTVLTINKLYDDAQSLISKGGPENAKSAERLISQAKAVADSLRGADKISQTYYQTQIQRLLALAEEGQKAINQQPVEIPVGIDVEEAENQGVIAWTAAQEAITAKGPIVIPGVIQVAPTEFRDEEGPQLPGYSSGGAIRGPGTGLSDSILARLSAGEFVVRARAVKNYGLGFLERLNSMSLPRFASGGPVGTPVNIYLPGGESFGMSAAPSVAKAMSRVLGLEVLKRGRR